MNERCPKCGNDVCTLLKYWTLRGKLERDSKTSKITVYLYRCGNGHSFRINKSERILV